MKVYFDTNCLIYWLEFKVNLPTKSGQQENGVDSYFKEIHRRLTNETLHT